MVITAGILSVGDVVRALSMAMKYCRANSSSEVFNVSTGVETCIIELVEKISFLLNKNPRIEHGPPRPSDPRRSVGSPKKAERILGFRATTDLASGLVKTLEGLVPALRLHHEGH